MSRLTNRGRSERGPARSPHALPEETNGAATRAGSTPRLSMNEVTTYRWSLDEDLRRFAEAGYDGIGVWLRKLRDFGEERGLELLRESRLTVSNVVWAGGFTGSDGTTIADSLAEARDALRLAGLMRAGSLVVCSGGRNHHTRRHAERLFRSALDELLPHAEASRVPLAIEPVSAACAASWSFVTRFEQALRLVERYDTPWLQLAFDTYHFPMLDEKWGLLRDAASRIAVVHLADLAAPPAEDEDRRPLGEGVAPLQRILRTLIEGGYTGFFDVELTGPAIEGTDYGRLLQETRRRFDAAAAAPAPGPQPCESGV